jgi:hypothetical protein
MSLDHAAAARRFRLALELFETGVDMMRQKLRREHPEWSDVEVDAQLAAWLRKRPGAEHGDAEGRPAPWPRRLG